MSSEWKSTVWQEKLKSKPVHYWIRDEIEEIIKEENIDRKRFCEVSKFHYSKIIDKFYYSFFDYNKKRKPAELSYLWLNFRKELNHSEPIIWTGSYDDYIGSIVSLIPETDDKLHNTAYYLILSQGWVYEGYISEIISVLSETDGQLEDFYIVSKKFDWCICGCDDGNCISLITK